MISIVGIVRFVKFHITLLGPPHVTVSPKSSAHQDHSDVELRCHAEGLPRPVIGWKFNDQMLEQGEKYYIHTCKSCFIGNLFQEWNEPSYEIMVLFVLHKLILQTHMCSYPVGLDVWFLVGPFVYFQTSCMRTAKALSRLRRCADLPKPSLVVYVISTIISWAGSNFFFSDFFEKDVCKSQAFSKGMHFSSSIFWSKLLVSIQFLVKTFMVLE